MSYHKQQMKDWLATKEIVGGSVVSIGSNGNDPWYFQTFKPDTYYQAGVEQPYDVFWDFNTPPPDERPPVDHILFLGVSPYIYDPVQMMRNFEVLSKRGTQVWIYSSLIHPQHESNDRDYLRMTRWFWGKMLCNSYFRIDEIKPIVSKTDNIQNEWSSGGFRLKGNYDNELGHLILATKI